MSEPSQRVLFLQDLARLVDGDAEAADRHAALLTQNAATGELLRDAVLLADRIGSAGDDYRPDPELLTALEAHLQAPPQAGSSAGPGAGGPADEIGAAGAAESDPDARAGALARRLSEAPVVEGTLDPSLPPASRRFGAPPADDGADGDGVVDAELVQEAEGNGRRKRLLAAGLAAAVALAGLATYLVFGRPAPPPPPPPHRALVKAPVAPNNPMRLQLQHLRHAGDAPGVRLLQADGARGDAPARIGQAIGGGTGLATSEATQAMLRIDGVGRAIVDVDSQLRVDPARANHLLLLRGGLLLDLRTGTEVSVLGPTGALVRARRALVQITTAGDGLLVQSLRGTVELGDGPTSAGLPAGGQALLGAGRPPVVSPRRTDRLDAARFSDFATEGSGAQRHATPPPAGQLSAIRPDDTPTAPARGAGAAAGQATATAADAGTDAGADAGSGPDLLAAPPLDSLEIEVLLQGPLATTTSTQHFAAAGSDGRVDYSMRLPADAVMSEVAMLANGEWVAAASGPGGGNAAAATGDDHTLTLDGLAVRAGQPTGVRVRYVQPLGNGPRGRRYRLPLPMGGEAVAGALTLRVRSAAGSPLRALRYPMDAGEGRGELVMRAEPFEAHGPLLVDVLGAPDGELRLWTYRPTPDAAGAGRPPAKRWAARPGKAPGQTLGSYAVVELSPALERDSNAEGRLVVLVDSSQSMAGAPFARAGAVASQLVAMQSPHSPVRLLACDAECVMADPAIAGDAAAMRDWLRAHGAAGATEVGRGLNAALRLDWPGPAAASEAAAQAPDTGPLHIVYFGDGRSSDGRKGRAADADLPDALATRIAGGHAQLTTVAIGGGRGPAKRGPAATDELARLGRGMHLRTTAGLPAEEAARRILAVMQAPLLGQVQFTLPAGLTASPKTDVLPTLASGVALSLPAQIGDGVVAGELKLSGQRTGKAWHRNYPVQLQAESGEGSAYVATLWALTALSNPTAAGWAGGPRTAWRQATALGLWPPGQTGSLAGRPVHYGMALRARRADGRTPSYDASPDPALAEGELVSLMEELRALEAQAADDGAREPSPRARPQRKRRVHLQAEPRPHAGLLQAVDAGRAGLEQAGAGSAAHARYVRALVRLGNLERLKAAVQAWRDALPQDPAGVEAAADLLMHLGRPQQALRTLEGLADLSPRDARLRERLADAFAHAGQPGRACSHRLALAHIDLSGAHVVRAVRCLRRAGRDGEAAALLAPLAGSPLGNKVDAALAQAQGDATEDAPSPAAPDSPATQDAPERIDTELRCDPATEVDLSVVTLRGRTLSWLGGRSDVRAEYPRTPGRERLGWDAAPGIYEVSAHHVGTPPETPLTCELTLDLPRGDRQRVKFRLGARREAIVRVAVEAER